MKNFRGFRVKFVQSNNFKGGYVNLTDLRQRKRVKISIFNTSFDDASDIAEEWLGSKGIKTIGRIENESRGYILFTDNFETPIK